MSNYCTRLKLTHAAEKSQVQKSSSEMRWDELQRSLLSRLTRDFNKSLTVCCDQALGANDRIVIAASGDLGRKARTSVAALALASNIITYSSLWSLIVSCELEPPYFDVEDNRSPDVIATQGTEIGTSKHSVQKTK